MFQGPGGGEFVESTVTHYIFYHDRQLLEKVVPAEVPENFSFVDLNSLAIPEEFRLSGISDNEARAVYSEYLGILSIRPTSEMVGLFTYSIPLKFCFEYAKRTNLYGLFLPEIKFAYLAGKKFDPEKLYGVEFGDYIHRETGNDVIREIDANKGFHVPPKDDSFNGPFKGSVVIKKKVFLEFQAWLREITLHLSANHGRRCKVDPKKINNIYKYWAGGTQAKMDLQWRWGLGLILERAMAYYLGRKYPKTDWVDMRFFLNESAPVEKTLSSKMKLYFFHTPSHEQLKDDWFLRSLKDDFELCPGSHAQIGPEGTYLEPGWPETMGKKIAYIVQMIRENLGKVVIFSDVDVQFFSPVREILLREIQNKDIVLIRDCGEAHLKDKDSNGILCTGFFVIRANDQTLRLWEAVRDFDAKHLLGDQRSLNEVLKNGFSEVRWGVLPDSFYSPGKDKLLDGLWEEGKPLLPPTDMVLHHANFTVGIERKVQQLRYVRHLAGYSKNLIILPYYSQEEVHRFSRLAWILARLGGIDEKFEFLLSARFDFPESRELYELYSKIAPTRSLRCTLPGEGITTPREGSVIEGPSAMFWDTMRFIEKNYFQDGGFVLWMEADMVPVRKDWLRALSAEWSTDLLMMGFFVDASRGMCPGNSHINGGACYAKHFFRKVGPENFKLDESWDKQILSFLVEKGLPYKYINGLLDLRYRAPTLLWRPADEIAILHGIKDDSAHIYVENKHGMTLDGEGDAIDPPGSDFYKILEKLYELKERLGKISEAGSWSPRGGAAKEDKALEPGKVVLIYQMGKVGSTAVLESVSPYLKVCHIHNREHFFRHHKEAEDYDLWQDIRDKKKKWKVISGVREPVARSISSFFQNMDDPVVPSLYVGTREHIQSLKISELINIFLKRVPMYLGEANDWFDGNIKKFFDLDVYAKPFDAGRGFAVYENSHAELLLIRQEDLRTVGAGEVRKFLAIDDKDFCLQETNRSQDKWYSPLRREFERALRLSEEALDGFYNAKYSRHFYGQEEIRRFREKWAQKRTSKLKSNSNA